MVFCGLSVISVLLFQNEFPLTGFFILLCILGLIIEFYHLLNKPFREVHRTILSIHREDFSLKMSNNKGEVLKDLSLLYEKQKYKHFEQESIKIIYSNILNGISTGLLILRKTEKEEWNLFFINQGFADIFQIPVYTSWTNLKRNLSVITEKFEEIQYKEVNQTLEITIDSKEVQTYSFKTSLIKTYNYSYYIVSLDSIQSIVEKKEKQAWYDLMKVLSHEMMNTLTPINSLANSMTYFVEKDSWDTEDKKDFKESLKTIQKKTVHMLEFVDNYRLLTNFPQAQKKLTNLSALVHSCVEIMKTNLEERNIQVDIQTSDEMFYNIDPILTERVLINLITNSMYALDTVEGDRHLFVKIYQETNRAFIEVQDNGQGIDNTIRDKIFIPFFTTRDTGAGIGLALSKNIMEAQNGYLTYKNVEGATVFIMSFIEE